MPRTAPTTSDTLPATAPYPQPTSPPPGGGEWTWDTQAGQWVSLDQPAAPAAQSE